MTNCDWCKRAQKPSIARIGAGLKQRLSMGSIAKEQQVSTRGIDLRGMITICLHLTRAFVLVHDRASRRQIL